jgi:hypothetical protein
MGLKQLYYTSCERGLSGYPGYQFNAVTPGVEPEVMREVERLTAYEPPRSLGFEPTDAEVAACPVNLCFAPGDGATVVANVTFVGADFSRRFGNYFVHALATTTPEQDLGPLLPIELWQAPFWRSQVADSLELPELAGPLTPGPIDRRGAAAFAAARGPAAERLGALLSAAAQAVEGAGRSVVLVDDAGGNAHWIALLSYLLPASLVRRMSFTTYHHRPSYCGLHVIGTVPGNDLDLSDDPLSSFYLFDFAGDRVSKVEVHPAAALLARAGVSRAEALWRRAAALGGGGESTLDDWYPLVAVTAAAQGMQLGEHDYDTAIDWYKLHARGLAPDDAGWVGASLLAQEAFDHRHVGDLMAAASASGADSVQRQLDEIECRIVDHDLERLLAGAPDRPPALRVASVVAQAHARRRCEEALAGTDLALATALLEWTDGSEVHLSPSLLKTWSERVVGPVLLLEPSHGAARRVAEGRDGVLRGVVAHLALVAERDPPAVSAALERGLTDLLPEAEVTLHPRLRELLLLEHGRQAPSARMDVLHEVAELRGAHAVEGSLLRKLWPDGGWTLVEARQAAELLSDQQLTTGEVPEWLGRVLTSTTPVGDRAALAGFVALCNQLAERQIDNALPQAARGRLHEVSWVAEKLQDALRDQRRTAERVEELASHYPEASEPIQRYLENKVPDLLARSVPAADLARVLSACPRPLFKLYLDQVEPGLRRYSPDPVAAAQVFRAMVELRALRHAYGREIDQQVLIPSLSTWKRRDLERVASLLLQQSQMLAQSFTTWWRRHVPDGLGRRLGGAIKGRRGRRG